MNQLEIRLKRIKELSQLMINEIEGLQEDVKCSKKSSEYYNLQLDDLMDFLTVFSPNASESALITKKLKSIRHERRALKDTIEGYGKIRKQTVNLKDTLKEYQQNIALVEKTKSKRYVFRTKNAYDFYFDFDNVRAREVFKSNAPIAKHSKKNVFVPENTSTKAQDNNLREEVDYLIERTVNDFDNTIWRLTSLKDNSTVIEHRKMIKVMDKVMNMNLSSLRCDKETFAFIKMSFGSIKKITELPLKQRQRLLHLNNNLSYHEV